MIVTSTHVSCCSDLPLDPTLTEIDELDCQLDDCRAVFPMLTRLDDKNAKPLALTTRIVTLQLPVLATLVRSSPCTVATSALTAPDTVPVLLTCVTTIASPAPPPSVRLHVTPDDDTQLVALCPVEPVRTRCDDDDRTGQPPPITVTLCDPVAAPFVAVMLLTVTLSDEKATLRLLALQDPVTTTSIADTLDDTAGVSDRRAESDIHTVPDAVVCKRDPTAPTPTIVSSNAPVEAPFVL